MLHCLSWCYALLQQAYPYAFIEAGVAMLLIVLKSKRAKEMNIAIMRAFVALRKMLVNNTELRLEIEYIKKKVTNHDKNIELVFQCLDELLEKKKILNHANNLVLKF